MKDSAILAADLEAALKDVALQAERLGTALLSAAPGEKSENGKVTPTKSVEYLLASAEANRKYAAACRALIPEDPLSSS
ncbi:MAG TPA: hypothetical protein VNC84_05500 [Gammaproteobacteria bacterium]|jgi:hypothetical protein|nr:hypothetical protein [Gammaproteobacteria bacterium]